MQPSEDKDLRVLTLYTRFQEGKLIQKKAAAQEFAVTERTIQRDINTLQNFLNTQIPAREIIYDHSLGGHRLVDKDTQFLTNDEILAVGKILLESRSLVKDEMLPILDKLIASCVPAANKKMVKELLANETLHYLEPHHGQKILPLLWTLGQAIREQRVLQIIYKRLKEPQQVTRTVEPVGLMFSDYYFYLTAFLRDVDKETHFADPNDRWPTIYRLDRIQDVCVLDERFYLPYKDRFEEGEFRKRVQFMYSGKLQRLTFRYTGISPEAILDRLPTAQIIAHDEQGWLITAEVFGKGAQMWLKTQGDAVQILAGGDDA